MATKTEVLSELTKLRDEARVQLHLLSMDARKRWDSLEKQLTVLEQKLVNSAEGVTESTAESARGLKNSVKNLFKEHDVLL